MGNGCSQPSLFPTMQPSSVLLTLFFISGAACQYYYSDYAPSYYYYSNPYTTTVDGIPMRYTCRVQQPMDYYMSQWYCECAGAVSYQYGGCRHPYSNVQGYVPYGSRPRATPYGPVGYGAGYSNPYNYGGYSGYSYTSYPASSTYNYNYYYPGYSSFYRRR